MQNSKKDINSIKIQALKKFIIEIDYKLCFINLETLENSTAIELEAYAKLFNKYKQQILNKIEPLSGAERTAAEQLLKESYLKSIMCFVNQLLRAKNTNKRSRK